MPVFGRNVYNVNIQMPTVKLENENSICSKLYKHSAWDEKIICLDSTFTI